MAFDIAVDMFYIGRFHLRKEYSYVITALRALRLFNPYRHALTINPFGDRAAALLPQGNKQDKPQLSHRGNIRIYPAISPRRADIDGLGNRGAGINAKLERKLVENTGMPSSIRRIAGGTTRHLLAV